MATSGRPRRRTSQRCLEYNGGLLHEEELAIRRALQASLTSSKYKPSDKTTGKQDKDSSGFLDVNSTMFNEQLHNNNNNNSLASVEGTSTKGKKGKQGKQRRLSEDEMSEKNATLIQTTKKPKLSKDNERTRSRSSSRNSSVTTDSCNSTNSRNITNKQYIAISSSGSQTSAASQNIKDVSRRKLHKKDKFAVRVRKKLLNDKIFKTSQGSSHMSDCDSTKSSSTVSVNVTSKKARKGRKRKCAAPVVNKKFATVVPSFSSVLSTSSLELNTSGPLAKAEDFINFLCLRGHPLMPKELEVFYDTYQPHTPSSENESPSSPPSSLVSELPSSPASSNLLQNFVESPCETPVCETPLNSEDDGTLFNIHAMRMYAGIENRPKATNSSEEKGELTIAEMDSEEEPNKIAKCVTPPLSFRVSPCSALPTTTTSKSNLSPSPARLVITSPHMILPSTSVMNQATLGVDKPRHLYHTPASSAFGSPIPPPLLLSPGKSSSLSSNNCCSPPPLLYIPAAAQRVTHLHGPPKLERVATSSSDVAQRQSREGYVQEGPPILVNHKPSDFSVESRFMPEELGKKTLIANKDSAPTGSHQMVQNQKLGSTDQELSNEELPCGETVIPRPSSTGGITRTGNKVNVFNSSPEDNISQGNNLRTFQPYIRNSRSCPLHSFSGIDKVEQTKKTTDCQFIQQDGSSLQKSRVPSSNRSTISPPSGYRNQGFCPLHSLKRSDDKSSPRKNIPVIDLRNADSPDYSVGVGGSSLLENLQRAHDKNTGLSPARNVDSKCCEHETSRGSSPSLRDSRLLNASSVGSVSIGGSCSSEVCKSPLNSIAQDKEQENPSVRRPRSRTGSRFPVTEQQRALSFPHKNFVEGTCGSPVHCTVDNARTSPFVPVRDVITPILTSPGPATFVGQFGVPPRHLTNTPPLFEYGMRDALSPRWSHLQPSYSLNSTPPRPYTLSINSSPPSTLHNNHCCAPSRHYNSPRAIPILPPTHLPTFRHVSPNPHFNGELRIANEPLASVNFGRDFSAPMGNQSYNLLRAFEAQSSRKRQMNAEILISKERNTYLKAYVSGSGDENRTEISSKRKPITVTSSVTSDPNTQNISIDLSEDETNVVVPSQTSLKLSVASRDQHTLTLDKSRDQQTVIPSKSCDQPSVTSDKSCDQLSVTPDKSRDQHTVIPDKSRDQHTVTSEKSCDHDTVTPSKSRDQHTVIPEKSRDQTSGDVTKTSSDDKNAVHTEIKKRRGRPPGSKNKKPSSKNVEGEGSSKKESLSKEETSKIVEEKESANSKKTKKVESPILRPTDEEFKDPIKYLKSVQSTLKKFGICVIDPPESWKLESHLPGNPRFTTKRQLIHRLQKRWGPTEIKLTCIEKHMQQQQSSFRFTQMPVVGGCDLDLPEVSRVVKELGGMQKVIDTKKWNKVADLMRIPKSTQDRVGKLQDAYCKYLLSFDLLPESEKETFEKEVEQEMQKTDCEEDADQNKCYLKGRSFSMGCFQRTARSFQDHFFKTEPSVNDVEREYWKIVQSREKYVAAHHVKLDTKKHGSCFPTSKTDPYTKSGWNLNVLPHLKGSSLRHTGNVEDLTIPWLNIDMLFSTKRWTTTPLQTHLIDYLHSSNDKVWYGVPESDIEKFPYTKKDRTNDFEDGEAMVSPSNMTRESSVNVTRLVQKQGQFVVIAPEVFHCNISCGYSVSETVAFAFPDWLLKVSSLNTELFTEWPGFSYEKVLLKVADEVTHADKDIIECLHRELKRVRDREISTRKELKGLGVLESLCTNTTSKGVQSIKTISGSIQVHSTTMYCGQCNQLCHLSAVLSEEDTKLLCLSDAVDYIREDENSSESLSIVTNCSLSQIDEVIESIVKKLNLEDNKSPQ